MTCQKVWSKFSATNKDGTVVYLRIVGLQETSLKDLIELFMSYYVKDESTSKAAGVPKSARAMAEQRKFLSERFKLESYHKVICCLDNDEENINIIGASVMELTTTEKYYLSSVVTKTVERKKYFELCGDMRASYEVMTNFELERYFVDRGVVVHPDFRGLGIAQELLKVRRMVCKEHRVPIHGAWMTSYGTQKAAERDGWETMHEINYEEFGTKHGVKFKKGPPFCKYMIARIGLD